MFIKNRIYPQKTMFTGTKGPTDVPLVGKGYLKGLWGSNMQHTAVNLVKMSWAPLNNRSFFYNRHIITLDLFCCHCRRSPYLRGIRVLQWCPDIRKSLNKADHCKFWAMAGEKSSSKRKPSLKFWLLTPTRYQVLRRVILKMILRKRNNYNSKSQQKSNHRLSVSCQLPWELPKGRNTNSHPFVGPEKVWKKLGSTRQQRQLATMCWCFSQKLFICWWNKPLHTTMNT